MIQEPGSPPQHCQEPYGSKWSPTPAPEHDETNSSRCGSKLCLILRLANHSRWACENKDPHALGVRLRICCSDIATDTVAK